MKGRIDIIIITAVMTLSVIHVATAADDPDAGNEGQDAGEVVYETPEWAKYFVAPTFDHGFYPARFVTLYSRLRL